MVHQVRNDRCRVTAQEERCVTLAYLDSEERATLFPVVADSFTSEKHSHTMKNYRITKIYIII